MELDERKMKILKAIISTYLETGDPVGSRTIAKDSDLHLSSATIRNEMADLEELGYHFTDSMALYLNHTNSGSYYNPELGGGGGLSFYDKEHSTWSVSFEYLY